MLSIRTLVLLFRIPPALDHDRSGGEYADHAPIGIGVEGHIDRIAVVGSYRSGGGSQIAGVADRQPIGRNDTDIDGRTRPETLRLFLEHDSLPFFLTP